MAPIEIHSKSPEDTRRAAEILLKKIEEVRANFSAKTALSDTAAIGAVIVGLYGDLGSGKTTFTQFFGELLGVREKIASPTFVLEKIYKIADLHLVHIDAYRLESEKEMENLGWKEIVQNPQNIILIEWPERIAGLMPKNHIQVRFEHAAENPTENENFRKITIILGTADNSAA